MVGVVDCVCTKVKYGQTVLNISIHNDALTLRACANVDERPLRRQLCLGPCNIIISKWHRSVVSYPSLKLRVKSLPMVLQYGEGNHHLSSPQQHRQ